MAEQAGMVDLQGAVYNPCGQIERGEEMTELEVNKILNGLFGVESCEKNSARENKLRFMLLEKIGYKPKKSFTTRAPRLFCGTTEQRLLLRDRVMICSPHSVSALLKNIATDQLY